MEIDKINVLELVDSFGYAGTQRVVINFCKYIDRNYFNVFACAYDKGGPREENFKGNGVEYLVANNNIDKIINFIKNKNIQIVHFHRSGHFVDFQFDLIRKIKDTVSKIIILETNVFGKFDKKSFKYLDGSLQISKMMLNERYGREAGFFDFKKMKIVYNPIDFLTFNDYKFSEEEVNQYKNKIGISDRDFVIGKMGRPHIAKWSDLLIDMMPCLIKAVPNVKLIIQSIPESRKNKILKSKYKCNYIFLDETSDDREVALFYSVLDVYVHASKIGESFGMTLAEAAIFKKPAVVNSTPDRDNNQIELVDHMKTGIIANYPQTFARAVEYLYKNPQKRVEFGENNYEKVKSIYDAEKISRQLEKVFIEKLLEKDYLIDLQIIEKYNSLRYEPTEKDIMDYKIEYQKRLVLEFGKLSISERLMNIFYIPKKLYWKVRDFLEDKKVLRIKYGK